MTIQATGMGGRSAAIVLSELIALGAQRAIRVGTCGALSSTLALGDLVIASESVCADGASRAIADAERAVADEALTQALARSAPSARVGAIVSVDLFYDDAAQRDVPHDALAIEMEAATLFALGAAAQVPVACLLAVTDTFDAHGARTRIADDALHAAAERMGAVALDALAQ